MDKLVHGWKFFDRKIVFTNGCFDLLHFGHLSYLAEAAALGNHLVIGLNSDASVSRLKGPERPIIPQDQRAFALASLRFVSAVVIFDEDTPLELIQEINPNIITKGGDYKPETVVGADHVRSTGGEVVILPFVTGFSSTNLIEKIRRTDGKI